jgi:hypothetical protein
MASLLQDSFEAAEGTNITAAGWTAIGTDPGDSIEIQATPYLGSSSVHIVNSYDANQRIVYRSFTQRISGKITVLLYYRPGGVDASKYSTIAIIHGTNTNNDSYRIINLFQYEDDIKFTSGGADTTIASAILATNEWHKIELELNMDINKFNVWINHVEYNNGGSYWSFEQDADPGFIYLIKRAASTSVSDANIDELDIYDGARVEATVEFLLQDGFEAADGTNITAYGWGVVDTDPGDFVEIDTAQKHYDPPKYIGASSVLLNDDADELDYTLYKPFTQQTAGHFTVRIWHRDGDVSASDTAFFTLSAVNTDVDAQRTLGLGQMYNDINSYAYPAGWSNIILNVLLADTWQKIEVEVDLDAEIFCVWVDDSRNDNGGAWFPFANSGVYPAYIFIKKASNAIADKWLDDLIIYKGARASWALAQRSVAITGTATASITESDVVAGGKTIIITLTGDTFVA